MSKIFVRERLSIKEGDKRPRFAVVGVHGADMKFFKTHLRKSELDAIAQAIGAELVSLPHGSGEHDGGGQGKHRRHGHRHGETEGDAASA